MIGSDNYFDYHDSDMMVIIMIIMILMTTIITMMMMMIVRWVLKMLFKDYFFKKWVLYVDTACSHSTIKYQNIYNKQKRIAQRDVVIEICHIINIVVILSFNQSIMIKISSYIYNIKYVSKYHTVCMLYRYVIFIHTHNFYYLSYHAIMW